MVAMPAAPINPDRGSQEMTFRTRLLASTTLLGLAGLLPGQAEAGLIGSGRTVSAFYLNGFLPVPAHLPFPLSDFDPTSLSSPVTYNSSAEEATSGSDVTVGDTQIIITNLISLPFCFSGAAGSACTDEINGFDFKFTGENITGVSVNGATPAAFQPVTGTFGTITHLGLQLLSNNEIRVDVTGDGPAVGAQLILDLTFDVPPPPPPAPNDVPEPVTIGVLGSALAGLAAVRRRRKL
jgi:hypothetical protein